ncbi:E3 ubiquitin-protein ligase ubr1 [Grifola frondosa]|uniref:E3 ubiquitin-protein ligase n=1 Tax=Grifola frondosa TaxID=5627 RepID=A0A1C7MP80_GRIFR|nr:E3 ubiquitin-protein ligase ubr1 [Grifola frondosa]
MAQAIAQIDLGVTVRRSYDTFREQVTAVIIEWLLDLTRSRIGSDTLYLREIIALELLSVRKNSTLISSQDVGRVIPDVHDPARIDWLFFYHARLWKKPRLNLQGVASHFANVYHRVIDAYLLTDLALFIVRHHNIVSRLLAIITAFFTNQIQDKRIIFPPNADAELDVDTFPFKSKRFMPVFSDLRYLCHNEPVQDLIAHNREFINQFAKTCQIFMCVNPNKRAASSHVEYETDAWISVFNVTLSLSRVIKVYGEAFSRATAGELVAAITTVVHHILMVTAVVDDQRDVTRFPPVLFHEVIFGEVPYKIIDFDVLDGWVSFHHSLQWLLAELFKHVNILSEESLQTVGLASLRDVCLRNASEEAMLTIIDYPLRVLSMIAQIRTGLWVRNGFAIRGQLLHYRDFMLRELCYDQDLFILQTSLVVLDPNTVFISMLDRFQLIGYFSGATLHPSYDSAHLSSMVEELLYVLITILTETACATKMPLPTAVRREIVHALAVGPCTFTDLVKRVAERMVDDVCFERVLKEVATFKAPESTADFGMYELKDEAFDEVNPFFYHYTRNKREEVDIVLRNRLKKKTGNPDPVIVPKPLNITKGPFSTLSSAFESEVLVQTMFYGIYNILVLTDATGAAPPSAEAILDQILQLAMLAVVERPHVFSGLAVYKVYEESKNLLDVLCTFEHHDKYSSYKARVQWILSQIALQEPGEVQKRRMVPDTSLGEAVDPNEAKKRAAKARQEEIMRRMKEQQASFAINMEDINDDEDDDMGETPEAPISYGTCIVCQEELNSTKAFGSLGFIQPSRHLRRHPDAHLVYINEAISAPPSLDRLQDGSVDTRFPLPDTVVKNAKPRGSTNFEAFPSQFTSGSIRQRHRNQATRNHPESIPRKEYICPLCKSLGNVILPVVPSAATELNAIAFPDWIRAAGIGILKSKPDPTLESLQPRNGTGEFVFWSAQDPSYQSYMRVTDRPDSMEVHKMVDTMMIVVKNISQQTRHLRDRPEPEPGERGAGIYLPEELVGYTIAALEVAQRGQGSSELTVADGITDSQYRMIRGALTCLTKLAALSFKGRPDEGRDAVKQAIIKRLLPEWSRTSLTSFAYPLLLRDPFAILIETAAVAPDMLRHVLILTYYACLARTVIGLVYTLNKSRSHLTTAVSGRSHEDIFGDIRMFFMSVVRHSPVFEQAADMVIQSFGEARIEKLLYTFTLPFLRRAAILCRAVMPSAFPSPASEDTVCEYRQRLVWVTTQSSTVSLDCHWS